MNQQPQTAETRRRAYVVNATFLAGPELKANTNGTVYLKARIKPGKGRARTLFTYSHKMIDALKDLPPGATQLIGGVFERDKESGATVFAPLFIPARGRRKAA